MEEIEADWSYNRAILGKCFKTLEQTIVHDLKTHIIYIYSKKGLLLLLPPPAERHESLEQQRLTCHASA